MITTVEKKHFSVENLTTNAWDVNGKYTIWVGNADRWNDNTNGRCVSGETLNKLFSMSDTTGWYGNRKIISLNGTDIIIEELCEIGRDDDYATLFPDAIQYNIFLYGKRTKVTGSVLNAIGVQKSDYEVTIMESKKTPNKGSQNCGVDMGEHSITICNNKPLSGSQIAFLRKSNGIYPKLKGIFQHLSVGRAFNHSFIESKYFHEWERMDGDMRDFFFNHFPKKIATKYFKRIANRTVTVQDDRLLHFMNYFNFQTFNAGTELLNIYRYSLLYQDNDDDTLLNKLNLVVLENPYDTGTDVLVCKKEDKPLIDESIMLFSKCCYACWTNHDRSGFHCVNRLFEEIVVELSRELINVTRILSEKQRKMLKSNFYFCDLKWDNIVYKHDPLNDTYDYFMIDPESSLCPISNDENPAGFGVFNKHKVNKIIDNKEISGYGTFKVHDGVLSLYELPFFRSKITLDDKTFGSIRRRSSKHHEIDNLFNSYISSVYDKQKIMADTYHKENRGCEISSRNFRIEHKLKWCPK